MPRRAEIATIETDLTWVADGLDALDDLEALMLYLCQRVLNEEQAERMSADLSRARRGLATVRKWMSWIRNGRHLRENKSNDRG
jgi:hypothetical protein